MAGLSWCIDWDVRRFAEIDSTNTWLLERARAGAVPGLVAVADHQTAGRGRLGRRWEAPPGANLLCSVLLGLDGGSAAGPWLAVARVALAARAACEALTGGSVAPGLKWPNDLLVGDAKLAGVLAEVESAAVVVGIGLNVGWAPDGAARLGAVPGGRDGVLERLLAELGPRLDRSPAEVLTGYRAACVTLGRPVRVELASETFTGTAAAVADDGRLVVETGAGRRTVTAGDVVHLR